MDDLIKSYFILAIILIVVFMLCVIATVIAVVINLGLTGKTAFTSAKTIFSSL